MNWLEKLILSKQTRKQIEQKAAFYQPGIKYRIDNGRIVSPPDNKTTYVREGYLINDVVFACVNMILDKVRLPYWSLFKIVDESSLKKYESLIARKNLTAKEYKQAMQYKEEALEPIDNYNLQQGKLKDLLTYPNEKEVWQDHITNCCGFKLITGDSYEYGETLKGGANEGLPNMIWTLPGHLMTIKATDQFPVRASSYELMMWNQRFTKEEILHEAYWNPDWGYNGNELYGTSPLKAIWKNIIRSNTAKDTSTAKFNNGGLVDIIYMDDDRFDAVQGKEQVEALKIKLAEEYSGPPNAGKHAVSGYKVGVAPVGLSPVELAIIQSEVHDGIMICNAFGVPPEMLGLIPRTYNTAKEAEKALTLRCAFPLLISKKNYLNWKFQSDWGFKGQNVYLDYDTDCFPELQVDMTEVINATSRMIMVSPDEERTAIGWEALNTPESKEQWVLQGGSRVPLSDFQANPVDDILNAMNNGANGINGTSARQGNSANGNGKVSANGVGKNLSH